jgi:integrase
MRIYQSVFHEEIDSYLQLQAAAGKKILNMQIVLGKLDAFFCENDIIERQLNEAIVNRWLGTVSGKPTNKESYIARFRGFARYLQSLGITAFIPEYPCIGSAYVPYVFSEEEWNLMITKADNLPYSEKHAHSAVQFCLLMRVLFGCGLRLGEALSLQIKDIDFAKGTLFIRHAKNDKQRFVPMDWSLVNLISDYMKAAKSSCEKDAYLFTNPATNARFSFGWARKRMAYIMKAAGIVFVKNTPNERGPCLHCLRHTFVLRSFGQLSESIPSFEDIAPFVSVYLGHSDVMETDKYLQGSYELYSADQQKINTFVKANSIFPEVIDE